MSEQNKGVVRRLFEAVNARDLDVLDELVHGDVTYHGMQVSGLEELKRKSDELLAAFPDMLINVEDLIAEGDKVVVRLLARGTHTGEFEGIPATNHRIEAGEFDIFRIQGGKIAEVWHLYDAFGLMSQLGVLPQPEGAEA